MSDQQKTTPQNWREGRRRRAWELSQKGWKQKDIAEALGVTAGAVSQWLKAAREDGPQALRQRKGGGPKPRLSTKQLERFEQILQKGATDYGFQDDVWTQPRVAQVIKQTFGVQYTPGHVGRLLKRMGWTRQKPVIRATQRDEQAIEAWRTQRWPDLKKKPERKNER